MHPVLRYMTESADDMTSLLGALVEMESPSTDKHATDALSRHLEILFRGLGCRTSLVPQTECGDHLRIEWGSADEQLLVLCHMDTVWPLGEVKKRPFRVEDGRAYGPGVFDMKAGIVNTFFALKYLTERELSLNKKIVIVMNTDEEAGSRTSTPLITEEARRSTHALVLEPPEKGAVKTARKGGGGFRIEITGKPAHAGGEPEKGLNAIVEMAHQVLALHAMNDFTTGTTVNVGVVTGGTRSNVVPASSVANVDFRAVTRAEAEALVEKVLGLKTVMPGTTMKITGGIGKYPMERTESIVECYLKAKQLAAELGFDLKESSTGGCSDGNLTASLGVTTLDGLGAVGDGGHAESEYVLVESMPKRAALLARLLETL